MSFHEPQEHKEGELPFLMDEDRRISKHERKTKRERQEALKKLLMEGLEKEQQKKSSLDRLLHLASLLIKTECASFDRQFDLYIQRSIKREAGLSVWRSNRDYSSDEMSPYYGNASEFIKEFPNGISDWRKEYRKQQIESYMPEEEDLDSFLDKELETKAHYVPEGKDEVSKLGDKEPKIWSDHPEWKSIDEFIKAYRKHFGRKQSGQAADDAAALKAARDFVKYWRLTTKKPRK